MSIGAKQCIVSVEDTSSLKIGCLVAVNVADCPPPCIGKVVDTDGNNVTVVWLKGSYNKAWSEWIIQDKNDLRKKVPWTDTITRDSILLFDFHLTKHNHLKKETVICLRKLYVTQCYF